MISLQMIQMHTSIDIDKCPVLHPTVKEFEDFRSYVENLDATLKHTYGMVKVQNIHTLFAFIL